MTKLPLQTWVAIATPLVGARRVPANGATSQRKFNHKFNQRLFHLLQIVDLLGELV
jgi:hypothetical protein